jgi:flagellar hook protein FlgE
MSIWTSLYTATSGLGAHGDAISIVGDNIANSSTIGFKASRADFEDIIGGTAPNGQRVGAGVRMGGVEALFGQGAIQQTGRSLDMGIRGNGFFVLAGTHDGAEGTYYSRDGRFLLDKDGVLVNGDGLKLQGYLIDPTGQTASTASDLPIGGVSAPRATTTLDMSVNLDASATPPAAWNPADPAGTANYSTSTTVYDSLGNAHRADVYFRASGGGNWEWHAMVDGGELAGGTAGTPTEIASGTLSFTTSGAMQAQTTASSSASFAGAAPNQVIAFSFGDPIAAGGTGLAGSTQFAGASSVTGLSQDGFAAGALVDVSIADDGTITGRFSNGQTRPMARVALATFASETNLERAGSQLFRVTQGSGEALVGAAGSGERGAISSGSLEGSNVDLSNELVTLIAYQRAFQANARTVTTADEMLTEITHLKR